MTGPFLIPPIFYFGNSTAGVSFLQSVLQVAALNFHSTQQRTYSLITSTAEKS